MRGLGLVRLLLVLAASVSCGDVSAPEIVPGPETKEDALQVSLQPMPVPGWEQTFVGGDLTLRVAVYDAKGVERPSADAEVWISDSSVAWLNVLTVHDINAMPKERQASLVFLKEGSVRVIARLGVAADTFSITVGPRPPISTAIQVDSFAIIEHRYECAVDCWHIAYSPVLRVTNVEATGMVNLVWARMTLVGDRTRRCAIQGWLPAGMTRLYGYMEEYLWDNVLFFAAGDERIAADSGSFEMLVRRTDGRFEMVEATGPLLPLESGATLPTSGLRWGC